MRLLSLMMVLPCAAAVVEANRPDATTNVKARGTEVTYQVDAGIHGDIFPAFANFNSFQQPTQRLTGTVTVTASNPTDRLVRDRIEVQIPGWSEQEIQYVRLGAGQVRKLFFAPTFHDRLFRNREIVAATATVSVSDMGGRQVYATTVPVRLRSADDMYWGKDFEFASFIASWVTPHDPRVEQILSRAKEFMPGRRLRGYEEANQTIQELSTRAQARAVYRALQRAGVSYVSSSVTFGAHANADVTERVRMPGESLRQASANCIDGVVLYASIFENLGLDPVVVLIPGHAYVGVRLAEGSSHFLYLDTALTGRATFERAVRAANVGIAKYRASQIMHISIQEARDAGIYPMPVHVGLDNQISAHVREKTASSD
jgi:hypothetical protein